MELLGVSKDTRNSKPLKNKFDIHFLSKTILKPGKYYNLKTFKNFNIVRHGRTVNKVGGLAIAMRKHLVFSKIQSIFTQEDEFETLAVSIDSSMGKLYSISL